MAELAEVQLRLFDRNRSLGRQVLENERGVTVKRDFSDRRGRHAIPVREHQPFVDPGLGLAAQLPRVELARCQQDLLEGSVNNVPINVDVLEFVVLAQDLQLVVGNPHGTVVPQADVGDGFVFACQIVQRQGLAGVEGNRFQSIQIVGLAREGNVALDVGLFANEFVGIDDEPLDQVGDKVSRQHGHHDPDAQCVDDHLPSELEEDVDQNQRSDGQRNEKQGLVNR